MEQRIDGQGGIERAIREGQRSEVGYEGMHSPRLRHLDIGTRQIDRRDIEVEIQKIPSKLAGTATEFEYGLSASRGDLFSKHI
jgi:hypothetical protein